MSPGIPDASAWVRRAVLHVVKNYDVDGVHFDRIRTPGAGYSHDPISEARFNGEGNPDKLDWGGFMRSQITRDLRRIYGAIRRIDPDCVVSCAPFGINSRQPGGYQGNGTESRNQWYQDSFVWMQEGVVDMMFPMIYWEIGSAHPYEVLLADFIHRAGDRQLCGGLNTRNNVIAQIEEARRQGAAGTTIFSYGSIDFEALKAGPYARPAPLPERYWLTRPQKGIVVGRIVDTEGRPLVDARIKLDGDSRTYLSGGDGFYAILNANPGAATIIGAKDGYFTRVQTDVPVQAGRATELDITLRWYEPDRTQATFDSDDPRYFLIQ
jgi:hypothetical protein